MSSCELSIRFDRDDRTYAAGDEIRGEVSVSADKDVRCKALRVELAWRTHGAGNVDSAVIEEHEEPHVQLAAGRQTVHPFRFTAPPGPLSYHGQLLNVELEVRARADVPWSIDPKTSEDVIVVAGPRSRDLYLEKEPNFQATPTSSKTGKVLAWLFSPLILVLILMLAGLLLMLSPIILTILLVVWVRRRLAEGRLGRVSVFVDAPDVDQQRGPLMTASSVATFRRGKAGTHAIAPADDLRFSVRFMPPKAVEIGGVTATLVGEERCRSGSGSNAVTHKHSICEAVVAVSEPRQFMAGQPVELHATVAVPDGTAYSFDSSDNHLEWWLDVRIALPGWPDWTEKRKLRMVPR